MVISPSNQSSVIESNIRDAIQENQSNQDGALNSTDPVVDEVEVLPTESGTEIPNEFPRSVERIINTGPFLTTMDFHPVHETLLLVGKGVGDIELWDVVSSEKLFTKEFVVPGVLLEDMAKNPGISVNRAIWCSHGGLFGVAYSKRIVHLYSYHAKGNRFVMQLEIDAHVGSVNDVAFSKRHDKFVIVSCGDDKLIQVWDGVTGEKQFTFEGHDAPVYSLCPHMKNDEHVLFSVSTSGEIKMWLLDDDWGSMLTYNAPGLCSMKIAYSTDGNRRFSCGKNKNGEPCIIEWNEFEGLTVTNYHGLSKCSSTVVDFDISFNRFLAAGDENLIKIWDIDSAEILATIDADGNLPARPYICFNQTGNLLAVCTDGNQVKILVNDNGRELIPNSPYVSSDSSELVTESPGQEEVLNEWESHPRPEVPALFRDVVVENISHGIVLTRCQSLKLYSDEAIDQVQRLKYSHAGNAVLALDKCAVHLLWKWEISDANSSGLATTKCGPQLQKHRNGSLIINDIGPFNLVKTPSLAWSNNDYYLISTSGGMINLYNLESFELLFGVMNPPPAATCVMMHPLDNNILAIGFDDSKILIYNILDDTVWRTLRGHSSRITGLAFSDKFDVLVSCADDTKIVLWDTITWEVKNSTLIQNLVGWFPTETHVELDKEHNHFLAKYETQIEIYETSTLTLVNQWIIANFRRRIFHATYSCDCEWVYAVMKDGMLVILGASDLVPRFEIDPSAYLQPPLPLSSSGMPLVVAAHPQKPCQVALGLSNGDVYVIEPHGDDNDEEEAKWAAP